MLSELSVQTGTRAALIDITDRVQEVLDEVDFREGICHVFVPHTSAGLLLNENWDPSVRRDILETMEKLVPRQGDYTHAEGNSAAHIKAALLGFAVHVPVQGSRLALGRWQGIFLAEFDGPRNRRVLVKLLPG